MRKKADTVKQPIVLHSYAFYHKGKEYIIEAKDQSEARTLFKQLIESL